MKSILRTILITGFGAAMAASPAMAAFSFTNGDLVLGVQATGGTGNNVNVFFNLGSGVFHRDNPGVGTLGNISTTMSNAFGSNWYSREDVYFGVFGNLNQNPTSGIGSRAAVDGDPSRTVYLSSAAANPGSGQTIAAGTYGSSSLGGGAGNFAGMETILTDLDSTSNADDTIVINSTDNPVEWNNSWSKWNPTPGAAFEIFTGGIQQNFGKAGNTTYVDLQRVLATNTGANPTGVVGGGTYENTFGIMSDGSIVSVPEPSSSMLLLGAMTLLGLRRRR